MPAHNNPEFNERVAMAWAESHTNTQLLEYMERLAKGESKMTPYQVRAITDVAMRRFKKLLDIFQPIVNAVNEHDRASAAREHLGSYEIRVEQAAKDAVRVWD